jgi:hypothetical protein
LVPARDIGSSLRATKTSLVCDTTRSAAIAVDQQIDPVSIPLDYEALPINESNRLCRELNAADWLIERGIGPSAIMRETDMCVSRGLVGQLQQEAFRISVCLSPERDCRSFSWTTWMS